MMTTIIRAEDQPMEREINMCKKGDIYWAKLPVIENSQIQQGVRPIVIIANDKATEFSPTFQYVPITSKIKRTDLPIHIVLGENNLYKQSMALVEQESSIDRCNLLGKIGEISKTDMLKIEMAILKQHGINPYVIIQNMKMMQAN